MIKPCGRVIKQGERRSDGRPGGGLGLPVVRNLINGRRKGPPWADMDSLQTLLVMAEQIKKGEC
jgi:hypothetical protein